MQNYKKALFALALSAFCMGEPNLLWQEFWLMLKRILA